MSCLCLLVILVQFSIHSQSLRQKKPLVPALIAFGDSIVDPGNNNRLTTLIKSNFPPYGIDFYGERPTGRFCNGKIPTDFLASRLGLKELLPAYLDPNLSPHDLLTGVSFASGGAGYDPLTSETASVLKLSDQIELFKEYVGKLKEIAGEKRANYIVSESLYLSVIGTDDLANTYFSTPFRDQYNVSSYVHLLSNSAANFYKELYDMGARKIGVVGLPPVGCVPSQRTLAGGIERGCVEFYNTVAMTANSKLIEEVQMLNASLRDLKIIYIDIYKNLQDIINHPFDFGFEVSNKGCCGSGNIEVSILCNPLIRITCEDISKYVFWDSYHPTERAYKIITDTIVKNYIDQLVAYNI